MRGFSAVLWREMVLYTRRWRKHLLGVAVSPILYMLTFGYALGGKITIGGHSYREFLLPGLIAMCSMTQAFAMASEINAARFYSGIFEEIQVSPAGRAGYVLGEMCAGIIRAVVGCSIILVIGRIAGVGVAWGWCFWLAIVLNSFAFSALAVALAMLVKSHADQGLLTSFVITPMAFLGGTFFPLEALPGWAQTLLLLLPLSHASRLIRADALGTPIDMQSFLWLASAGAVCFVLALFAVRRART